MGGGSVRYVDKMRSLRVFGFATIYLFIYAISAIFPTIQSHAGSSELIGYFQNP